MAAEENTITDVPQWRIAGDWFDVCKCNIPCPCTFAQPPSSGDCEGVMAWHIAKATMVMCRSMVLTSWRWWLSRVISGPARPN